MGKSDIVPGKKFGKWTVLEINVINPNSQAKRKRKCALCQCECGTIRYKEYRDLYDGRSLSCGCETINKMVAANIKRGEILIGTKFGSLTVIEDLGIKKSRHWYKCQCDCGNLIEVHNNHLKSGHTQSCGCTKSQGEKEIATILRDNNINFSTQYTFSDLISPNGGYLRFDFAIFQDNKLYCLVEFDGLQHTKPAGGYYEQQLQNIQQRDQLKNEYCYKNNIPLIRIPYSKLHKITLQDIIDTPRKAEDA